jgi:glycosyltransferase involved in cell wall biosynthesis
MVEPRISIVIPAFNVALYVEAAVCSVLEQTVAPYEILIFNDGSTDETADILTTYAELPNVRYFSQENIGLGLTRNKGAQCARGDYLYFFDSDDLLDIHFVERMQSLIKANNEPDLIMFSGRVFTSDSEFYSRVNDQSFLRRCEAEGVTGVRAIELLGSQGRFSPSSCLFLVKKSFWAEEGLSFPPIYSEDEDIIIKLIVSARFVVIKNEILFERRLRQDSLATEPLEIKHVCGKKSNLIQSMADICLVPASNKRCRRILRKRCRRLSLEYIKAGKKLDLPLDKQNIFKSFLMTGNFKIIIKMIFG